MTNDLIEIYQPRHDASSGVWRFGPKPFKIYRMTPAARSVSEGMQGTAGVAQNHDEPKPGQSCATSGWPHG